MTEFQEYLWNQLLDALEMEFHLIRHYKGKCGVYFIGADGQSKVKIGKTSNLPLRMSELQCCSPVKLRLIRFIENADERKLHSKFSGSHAHGEWFFLTPHILEYLDNEAR